MIRGSRCIAVWLAVSLLGATSGHLLAGEVMTLGRAATWRSGFDTVLVPLCSAVAVACAAWFWCVTTVTAVEVLRGASPTALAGRGGGTRRIVLTLCGVAVATQLAGPAGAADGPEPLPSLAGLSVPDRAAAGRVHRGTDGTGQAAAPQARPLARPGFRNRAAGVVVRPGDSLWAIAEGELGRDADVAALVDHWHRTYAANRAVVGADPDLIHPGQRLVLPRPQQGTHRPSGTSEHEEQQ